MQLSLQKYFKMVRLFIKATFVQTPTNAFPKRTKTLIYDFLHSYDSTDSWTDLTNQSKITLPKNVSVTDENGRQYNIGGTNINIGGFDNDNPLFLKGDMVTIESGYRFFDEKGNDKLQTAVVFTGFISGVTSKKPFVLDCEDNMWKLKQIPAPNKTYKATDTLENILKDMLQGSGFTVNALSQTTFGAFRTQNETICEVLSRLRKDYHFESYFRGNELRCGAIVYVEQDAIDDGVNTFTFQQDIISDSLEYKRKDDINLSAIAYSINKKELTTTTKDGSTKTKKERLEVLVTIRNGQFVSSVKPAGEKADFAPNTAGERRTLYFWDVTDTKVLIDLATKELQKYYYTGFKGKFKTFGLPFIRQGDNVDLADNKLPERNGRYKVKSVQYTGGVDGLRQEIELDYKIL